MMVCCKVGKKSCFWTMKCSHLNQKVGRWYLLISITFSTQKSISSKERSRNDMARWITECVNRLLDWRNVNAYTSIPVLQSWAHNYNVQGVSKHTRKTRNTLYDIFCTLWQNCLRLFIKVKEIRQEGKRMCWSISKRLILKGDFPASLLNAIFKA